MTGAAAGQRLVDDTFVPRTYSRTVILKDLRAASEAGQVTLNQCLLRRRLNVDLGSCAALGNGQ